MQIRDLAYQFLGYSAWTAGWRGETLQVAACLARMFWRHPNLV